MIKRRPEVMVPKGQLTPEVVAKLERYGRVCYKSEDSFRYLASEDFLRQIIARGHESVIEHEKISVLFIVDRGISHEIVRHRIGSYSQESTRYCNYSLGKFGNQIAVIEPFYFLGKGAYKLWENACLSSEQHYLSILNSGAPPEEARSVLPNSLKTEVVVTYNLREWRHFFRLRCAKGAHPQMRQVAIPLLMHFADGLPVVFGNIDYDKSFPKEHYAKVTFTDGFFKPV